MDFEGGEFDDLNLDMVHIPEDHLEDELAACNIVTNRYSKYRRPHCDIQSKKQKDLNVMITDGDVFCETIRDGVVDTRKDRKDCQQAVVRMYGVDADENTYLINIRNF